MTTGLLAIAIHALPELLLSFHFVLFRHEEKHVVERRAELDSEQVHREKMSVRAMTLDGTTVF